MRLVKCVYCGSMINRSIDPYISVKQRYAHKKCEKIEDNEKELRAQLTKILDEIFGRELNFGLVAQQVKNYKAQYKYTLSGIIGTLYYCYKIKGMDSSKAQGIGLVPYFYKEARSYFSKVDSARESLGSLNIQTRSVHIVAPKAEPIVRFKQLSLDYLEEGSDPSEQ